MEALSISKNNFLVFFRRSVSLLTSLLFINCAISNINAYAGQAAVPDDNTLLSNGAIIGKVIVQAGDVFDLADPKQNKGLFRLADKIHINTRIYVIRDQLLFKSGDPYNPELLQESERILRGDEYIYDAAIHPVAYHDNQVDVLVKTRDAWTLTGLVDYSHQGGQSNYSIEFSDTNFLGLGKDLSISRSIDDQRTKNAIKYRDPLISPYRLMLEVTASDNSDGWENAFLLHRPFFALNSHWSYGMDTDNISRTEKLYQDSEVVDNFKQEDEEYNIFLGYSSGLRNRHVTRYTGGYSYLQNHFSALSNTVAPGFIPQSRTLSYPWVGFQFLVNNYIKTTRVNHIQRTEDINLGADINFKLGWSSSAWGADRNLLIYTGSASAGLRPDSSQLVLMSLSNSGRFTTGNTENLLLSADTRYFLTQSRHWILYSALQLAAGYNLDRENQLVLDGSNGLRGYPSNFLTGNRKFLYTLEQRYYTDWNVLQLFYVGAAAYFEAGSAWYVGTDLDNAFRVYKDFGLGLRFSSSRTSDAKVLHFDVAYPLDKHANAKDVQVIFHGEATF
jgi:outer membrane protein assembly factor BamA